MKKLFTLLTILILTVFSFVSKAQIVSSATTPTVSGDTSTTLVSTVTIYNTSASTIVVRVQRTSNILASGHDTYFCWGITCYPPPTNLSQAFTLAPGDSSHLICDAEPHGTLGTDQVTLNVFDTAHAGTNKVTVIFTFEFIATGINTLSRPATNFLDCSQSNVGDFTNINYSIDNIRSGKLLMRNLLGSVVKEIPLAERKGNLTVSTADLPPGLYMYFLYSNGEPVASRKTIISHR